MAALSCGIEAEMFGSLMMLASGRLGQFAQLGQRVVDALVRLEALGEAGDDTAGQRDVARLDVDARCRRIGPHHGQQRIRCQRGRLVGVRVDDGRVSHPYSASRSTKSREQRGSDFGKRGQ